MPERFEIRIDKIVAGGWGLGRHAGEVVFVPLAAPGDRLLVEVVEKRRDFLRAEVVEVRTPSPDRRTPPCPLFTSCGGCTLMHLVPEAQARAKREIVLESLRRGGNVLIDGDRLEMRTGPELSYRSRSRFHVGGRPGQPRLGFFARGSHRVVDVDQCLLLSDGANRALARVRAWLAEQPARARGVQEIEIWEERGRAILHFVVHGREATGASLRDAARIAGIAGVVVTVDGKARYRSGEVRVLHEVAGFNLEVGTGAFFQVNPFLMEALVEEVVPTRRVGRAADLYCGVGLFTLPLARVAAEVVGVEAHRASLEHAQANARRAGLGNVAFVEERAERFVARNALDGFDVLVVDPPRGGLDRGLVDRLVTSPPREIRYVSCDPAALGRDLGALVRGGFELGRVVALDLFPNTHHVEVVATLRRPAGGFSLQRIADRG